MTIDTFAALTNADLQHAKCQASGGGTNRALENQDAGHELTQPLEQTQTQADVHWLLQDPIYLPAMQELVQALRQVQRLANSLDIPCRLADD